MDNEIKTSEKKNPIKFILVLVIVVAAAAGLSYFSYTQFQSYQQNSVIEKYHQASPDETDTLFTISDSEKLMFDTEAYKTFEYACLGNTNNNLLALGSYAKKGTIVCQSTEKTLATIDGKEIIVSEHPSSYVNIIDNNVYYRDDTDRKIYRYTVDNAESECMIDANCGQTVVSVKGIYYIDYATKKLNCFTFTDSESKQLCDEQVSAFAVVGNSIFILKDNKDFGILKADGSFTQIDSDVDRFFYDGSVYTQKGSNIYRFTSFSEPETISEDTTGLLIYESNGYLYFADNEKVTKVSIIGEVDTQDIYTLEEDEIVKTIIDTGDTDEIKIFVSKDGVYSEKSIENNI